MRGSPAWVLAAGLSLCAACSAPRSVVVSVRTPAALPVRAFPNVWIVTSKRFDERRVARAFAQHLLARRKSRVVLVSRGALAARRAEGKVHAATVVVELTVRHEERTHAQWGTDPEILCDVLGCIAVGGKTRLDVQRLRSRLSIRVSDGATGRELQRVTLRAVEQGSTFLAMRKAAVTSLIERLAVLSDQRARRQRIELYPVDLDGMGDVLNLVEEGRWQHAREYVEALAAGAQAAALPAPARATLLYDLAQIRRFTRREPTLRDLAEARAALTQALALAPSPRARTTLEALDAQHRAMVAVLEQRAAARHNFELAR